MRKWMSWVLGALSLVSASAHASLVWSFQYADSGNTVNVVGTLTTQETLTNGGYLITGISGLRNGVDAITGLIPIGAVPGYTIDNLLLPGPGSRLDTAGIAFTTQSGGRFNVCGGAVAAPGAFCRSPYEEYNMFLSASNPASHVLVNFTAVAVPEPGTLALVLLTLAGVSASRARRPV